MPVVIPIHILSLFIRYLQLLFILVSAVLPVIRERTSGEQHLAQEDKEGDAGSSDGLLFDSSEIQSVGSLHVLLMLGFMFAVLPVSILQSRAEKRTKNSHEDTSGITEGKRTLISRAVLT